jgi:hypothetical protein
MASWVDSARRRLVEAALTPAERDRMAQLPLKLNSAGYDPWGLDPNVALTTMAAFKWLYTRYFRVVAVGADRMPAGPVIVAANHSGQFPIDGMLLGMALLFECDPPRVARGMVTGGDMVAIVGLLLRQVSSVRSLVHKDVALDFRV